MRLRLAVIAGVMACAGDPNERPATWSYLHPAIVAPSCATSSCHSSLVETAGIALDDREASYVRLIELQFVAPGEHDGRREQARSLLGYGPAMAESQPQPAASPSPVDFSTHVLSLASSALIALGKMPAPDGVQQSLDLEMAKHLIDVLAMLEAKTKGNLDEAEGKLLASLIYDLRVAYVDAQPKKK